MKSISLGSDKLLQGLTDSKSPFYVSETDKINKNYASLDPLDAEQFHLQDE